METLTKSVQNKQGRPGVGADLEFARRFVRLAKRAGVENQQQMQAIANVSRATTSKWVNKGVMSKEHITLWADYLNVTPAFLAFGGGQFDRETLGDSVVAILRAARRHDADFDDDEIRELVTDTYEKCENSAISPEQYVATQIRLLARRRRASHENV